MIFLLVLCCFLFHLSSSKLEREFTAKNNGENNTWKGMELNTQHRKILGLEDSGYLLDRYSTDITCRRHVKCIPLHKSTCMGTKLPYSFTTLDLIPEHVTQDIIEVDKIIFYIFFTLVSDLPFFLR